MIFTPTPLSGAYVVDIEPHEDNRGFFARAWCQKEFEAKGLNTRIVQINIGYNKRRGTVRGMHFQLPPDAEVKAVRCVRGAVYDVILDLRAGSPTYKKWFGVELTESNHKLIYIPEGFAHGYQALRDDTETIYQNSAFYAPSSASGVRYNDPAFQIKWPLPVEVLSEQDKKWPDFKD